MSGRERRDRQAVSFAFESDVLRVFQLDDLVEGGVNVVQRKNVKVLRGEGEEEEEEEERGEKEEEEEEKKDNMKHSRALDLVENRSNCCALPGTKKTIPRPLELLRCHIR